MSSEDIQDSDVRIGAEAEAQTVGEARCRTNEAISLEHARANRMNLMQGGAGWVGGNHLGATIGGVYASVPDSHIRDAALRAAADFGVKGRPIDEIIADARKIIEFVKGG